ncbi:hypothetical protein STEG23_004232 [Scotinomys teguina]
MNMDEQNRVSGEGCGSHQQSEGTLPKGNPEGDRFQKATPFALGAATEESMALTQTPCLVAVQFLSKQDINTVSFDMNEGHCSVRYLVIMSCFLLKTKAFRLCYALGFSVFVSMLLLHPQTSFFLSFWIGHWVRHEASKDDVSSYCGKWSIQHCLINGLHQPSQKPVHNRYYYLQTLMTSH